jgi:hypothetical protein
LEAAYDQAERLPASPGRTEFGSLDVLGNQSSSYVALVHGGPGVEHGTETTASDVDQHLLIGTY